MIALGISDHDLVYICRKIGVPRETPKIVETRQFKHFNENKFQQDLAQAFNYFTYNSDPNLACSGRTYFCLFLTTMLPIVLEKLETSIAHG